MGYNPKVLIVEDDNIIANLEARLLELSGFESVTASTAEQAFVYLNSERFDVIILDLMLPGMDGTEFLKRFRRDFANSYIPVIVVSSIDEMQNRLHLLDIGADDYITKPFNGQELVARVRVQLRIRNLEKRILHSERNYRSLVENARDAIVVIDKKLKWVFANKAILDITGHTVLDIMNQNPGADELVHPADLDKVVVAMNEILCGEKQLINIDFRIRTKDGRLRWINADCYPHMNVNPDYTGITVIAKDITDHKEAKNKEQLSIIGEFAAGIVHEINNPLTGIRSTVQFLSSKFEEPCEFHDDFNVLINEIDRLSRLTHELLNFAKPGILNKVPLDPFELLSSIIQVYSEEIKKRDINLFFDVHRDMPTVVIDPDRMRIALGNIILNAIQILPRDGKIWIRCKANDSEDYNAFFIEIEDNGPGVLDEEKHKIFNPFYTTRPSGVGLGLALTQRIVNDHEGAIEIMPGMEGGALFRIQLPIIGN